MTKRVIERILFGVIIIAIWEAIYFFGVEITGIWKSYTFPSPMGVLKSFYNLFFNNSTGINIYSAIGQSLLRAFTGFLVSVILGFFIGFMMSRFKYLQNNLKPVILGIQTLPSVCWVPFAILWFGLDQSAVIFVIVIGSAFSVAMNVENAISNVDRIYIRAAKTMGACRHELYLKVILPAAQPMLISGLRSAWSFAWRALMAAEMMISMVGIGQVLDSARSVENDINKVTMIMIIIIIIGTIIDKTVFSIWENKVRNKYGLDKK